MTTPVTTVFTSATTSAVTQPTVNGSVAVSLTNTSSFIGTVYLETSYDGALTWIRPNTPLTSGTMVTGPLNFSFSVNGPGPAYSVQHRLNCSAYTSGTLTAIVTEAGVPDANGSVGQVGPQTSTGSVVLSPAGIVGSSTNDSAPAGEIGEYVSSQHATVSATGVANTGTNGPAVASPVVMTLVAASASFQNGQCVFLTGTVGTGLVANTNYYVCNFNPATLTFNLASTLAKAMAVPATPDLNVTIIGSGTTTIHQGSYATSTTAVDVMGLALSPGDWEVESSIFAVNVASASMTAWQAWIAQVGASSAPTTAATIFAQGSAQRDVPTAGLAAANTACVMAPKRIRVSLSAAGYVALACAITFTGAQINPQGFIQARRMR